MAKKNTTNEDAKVEEVKEDIKKAENDKEEYIAKLNSDLATQTKKTDEYFEHLKRNMAEFDNFKKRMNKEKESMYSMILSDVLSSILPVLDNFENALKAKTADESYKEGMAMICNQLKEYLSNQGLTEIEALGTTFDPNLHEAVMHEENEEYGEKEIIDVLRKGYKINEKVIRHSMVKVAN